MTAGASIHWLVGAAERAGLGDASASACVPEMDISAAWATVGEFLDVGPQELLNAVVAVFGFPAADFEAAEAEARSLLPFRAARAHLVAPLRSTDRNLVVATADPVNVDLEQEVAFLSGRRTVFEVATPGQIREALATPWGAGRDQAALRLVETDEAPQSSEADSSGDSRQEATFGKGHILVVDDDPVGRLLIRTALEQRGFEVSEADDGSTAQPLLESATHFDLLLLDLMMEHVDGKTVLRKVRGDRSRESLPVVILTGSQNPEDERELLRIGADDYLRKPVDPAQLILRIEAALNRARSS